MYTANSMNCLTEAIGMGLRGNGTIPAAYSARIRLAKQAGMQVMELLKQNIRPRDIMTAEAFHNAEIDRYGAWLHAPTPCSICPPSPTSAASTLDLNMVNEANAKTPNLCHLAPAGPTFMEDLDRAGGVVRRHEGAGGCRAHPHRPHHRAPAKP